MIRVAFILALFTGPAGAWEFTPVPICTLTSQTENGEVRVTYNPIDGLYKMHLSYGKAFEGLSWEPRSTFSIEFAGESGLTISTNRHVISENGKVLSVQDTGFGNVLNGLEFNSIAKAKTGSSTMIMSLSGAAEPVQAFRACGESVFS